MSHLDCCGVVAAAAVEHPALEPRRPPLAADIASLDDAFGNALANERGGFNPKLLLFLGGVATGAAIWAALFKDPAGLILGAVVGFSVGVLVWIWRVWFLWATNDIRWKRSLATLAIVLGGGHFVFFGVPELMDKHLSGGPAVAAMLAVAGWLYLRRR